MVCFDELTVRSSRYYFTARLGQCTPLESDRVKPASSDCSRIAYTASSKASMSTSAGCDGFHTCSTGADVSTAFSASKLCCLAGPKVNWARGLQRAVSGAAGAEERRTNL